MKDKLNGLVKDIVRCKICQEELRNDRELVKSHFSMYNKDWKKASSAAKDPPGLNTSS